MNNKKRSENNISLKSIKKIAKYIGEYKKDTLITWSLVLFETICEVLVAYLTGNFLIDNIKGLENNPDNMNRIYLYSGLVALLAIVAATTGILAGYFCSSASVGFAKNLRKAMFVKIQDYSFKNIDKFSPASIVTRTTTDVTNVQGAFQMIIRAVMRAPFMMIFALIMCFITEPKLAWIFLVIIPLVFGLLLLILFLAHPLFVKVFLTYDKLNEVVQEDVDGIRVVKAFAREEYQKEKFNTTSNIIYRTFVKAERLVSFNAPVMNLAIYSSMIAISYFGSKMILSSLETELTLGNLTTLITYVLMIMNSLMMVSMVYTMIVISRNSVERINEILDEKSDIIQKENPVKEVKDGSIDFDNVYFAYHDDKYVLNNINLHIKSGETLGIIGSTGSSKTTLISLIARLFDVTKGNIRVGGVDIKDYDLALLRDEVAIVLQKNLLFTGTIKSNLLWGNKDATEKEIEEVCQIAQAKEFIDNFKDKYDTAISEGGSNLSGGQKQRLCIARALLKNSKVLILDDSTSACDTHTDSLIRKGLIEYRKDMTKIIIAQRVLSIKDCDNIIVMDKGNIVAQGNNETLLKTCDVYKELYDSQLKGGGDFDEPS